MLSIWKTKVCLFFLNKVCFLLSSNLNKKNKRLHECSKESKSGRLIGTTNERLRGNNFYNFYIDLN